MFIAKYLWQCFHKKKTVRSLRVGVPAHAEVDGGGEGDEQDGGGGRAPHRDVDGRERRGGRLRSGVH